LPTGLYTLSLHDALPISTPGYVRPARYVSRPMVDTRRGADEIAREVVRLAPLFLRQAGGHVLTLLDPAGIVLSYNEEGERAECRSEEHTSELQSRRDLVC